MSVIASQPKPKILVVDDEENMRFFLREALLRQDYSVDVADSGVDALDKIRKAFFDVVIMDIRMSKMDGVEALSQIHELRPEVPVIMMTAYGSKKVAMEAIENGAYDYFTKPFDVNELRVVVKRALEKQKLEDEIKGLRKRLDDSYHFDKMIGSSPEMGEILETVKQVIDNNVTVMVYGESGTGKELIASIIHENGPRRDKPFVRINCAAIPDNLLESELFGYEKGAFTGALGRKIGKFELAHEGSLFLDEIGDMSPAVQAKVLRVIEKCEFERLGGSQTIKSDVRIIAATHQDLQQMVRLGTFREDLYFRLNVVPIHLPPLRNRQGDIPLLVEHFLDQANKRFSKNVRSLSPDALKTLYRYEWPGNVRELENVIQRAVVLAKGQSITAECLPMTIRSGGEMAEHSEAMEFSGSLSEAVESIRESAEKRLITQALDQSNWSRSKAADILKICRKSLHNKMKKYNLLQERPDAGGDS